MKPQTASHAGMAELADAHGSGPCEGYFMEVRVLVPAPKTKDKVYALSFVFFVVQERTRTFSQESSCLFCVASATVQNRTAQRAKRTEEPPKAAMPAPKAKDKVYALSFVFLYSLGVNPVLFLKTFVK